MSRHIACITFDFDVLSAWIYRGMTSPTALSRGEFGLVGAERILSLLEQHRVPATWFIPGHTLESFPQICRQVHQAGHEIGHHGYLHEPPPELTREQEEAVLVRGNEAIRALTGQPARGYRSPSWDLSPHTVELLLAHGFRYDSSMMAQDHLPYRARRGDVIRPDGPATFGIPTDLVEMPVSWSLDDFPHFEFRSTPSGILPGLQRTEDVLGNWVDDFHYLTRLEQWGVLTYTFHPQVIGRGHRMLMLERLIQSLREQGAAFLTLEQAVEEFRSRESDSR